MHEEFGCFMRIIYKKDFRADFLNIAKEGKMRAKHTYLILLLVPALIYSTAFGSDTKPFDNYHDMTGDEVVNQPVTLPPYQIPALDNTADLVGDTSLVGTTWYEGQHNGTIGRMIELDDAGYLHFAWMNGENMYATNRHIYYNYINPTGVQGFPGTGYPVESSTKAGYNTLDVDFDSRGFPAFHWTNQVGGDYMTAIAVDFSPTTGTFVTYEAPPVVGVPEIIWPRMQFDSNQFIHILSTENPASGLAGDPQRHYYTRGTYDPILYSISYEQFEEVTWTMTIAGDVATSDVSDRIAFAWTYCRDDGFPTPGGEYSQRNNDIYYLIDEDGVDPNWSQAINLTDFLPPDLSFLPDTTLADMDTIRAYTDLSAFFDQDDYLHIAFTTPSFFELEGTTYWHASLIWHWSEQYPDDFHLIHDAFVDWDWNNVDCGAWNVKAQKPSLGQDPTTGYLYCTYQVFDVDTLALSQPGFPSGEIYISVSTDGGQNWAVGTNITNTITPTDAHPGDCLSEGWLSMAKKVDGECHIQYILDRDAGNVTQTEGTWTLNDVIYHNVPVGLISTTPLVPQDIPFHVTHGGTGVEPDPSVQVSPIQFTLSQNYPNPFNPLTVISYELRVASSINLTIYDINGQRVADLVNGRQSAGLHEVTFDASDLSSGIYIYRLETEGYQSSGKMVLMK
ncbi:hypothetical protein CEE37_07795 [candidate division LCP-89 bacterium B3_LCP]|uniref:Secretion system C-terminal sorting domain-containing protein n=1 Tax=candidate division LCP-89 bacterium B3_LCP TaxID=2012998 RepID=A0A532V0X4_UNCL8|nr:MAG: hypothetical protein CEE37_07795 [candidate division LCP-89 bacterium B3_LCP]